MDIIDKLEQEIKQLKDRIEMQDRIKSEQIIVRVGYEIYSEEGTQYPFEIDFTSAYTKAKTGDTIGLVLEITHAITGDVIELYSLDYDNIKVI